MSDSVDETPPYSTILAEQIEEGLRELNRSTTGLALSGVSAGLDIGFGPLLMAATYTTVAGVAGDALTRFLLALAYTIGFVFVVLGRSELFTEHTTLAVLPVLDGRASMRELGRLWGVVYATNVAGGVVFALFAVFALPSTTGIDRSAFVEIARPIAAHSPGGLLVGAILAGWLMGLLSWLVTAARETTSRLAFVLLVTGAIGFLHLPHSIAGNVEVLLATLVSPAFSWGRYAAFLAIATVGNAVGGTVFVALLKYAHVVRGGETVDIGAD
ncbi:formate/nitrite transporter family protein [Halorarius halobius]|uniref:formate/nitrite transporter family protein n=1 Tax=Halorarius halobius TaxID=2962671 RepID=UPI0020CF8A3F|nr:formate/nitrite transporter family protein [Halorarius halobius]